MAGRVRVLAGDGEDVRGQPAVVCDIAKEAVDNAFCCAREFFVWVPVDQVGRRAVHHGAFFGVEQLSPATRSYVVAVSKRASRELSMLSFILRNQVGFAPIADRRDPVPVPADLRNDGVRSRRSARQRDRDCQSAETDNCP